MLERNHRESFLTRNPDIFLESRGDAPVCQHLRQLASGPQVQTTLVRLSVYYSDGPFLLRLAPCDETHIEGGAALSRGSIAIESLAGRGVFLCPNTASLLLQNCPPGVFNAQAHLMSRRCRNSRRRP